MAYYDDVIMPKGVRFGSSGGSTTSTQVVFTGDKRLATCRDSFDNIHNFRGEPHVPGNDLLFKTPDAPS